MCEKNTLAQYKHQPVDTGGKTCITYYIHIVSPLKIKDSLPLNMHLMTAKLLWIIV